VTTTSASLLERLRTAHPGASDWQHLHDIYSPLIRTWLGRAVGQTAEADDLTQEVLVILVRELPTFQKQRHGSFRAWLRNVVVNRVRGWRRARDRQPAGLDPTERFLSQLEDPSSALTQLWDREHDKYLLDRLLAAARRDCEPATWEAFRLFALEGRPAAEVAARTGLTVGAVMSAKSRILKRLREEAAGLLDD
jgi:RNA polymerase sigma-70 factor, ECF subfamily